VVALQEGGRQPCQHVLQAVSNIILDVDACGGTVSDPAEAIASRLAERVRESA